MSVDRDRKYVLKHSPVGVGFQLVGVMPDVVFLTWEQAELLRKDLDEACDLHEKELAAKLTPAT